MSAPQRRNVSAESIVRRLAVRKPLDPLKTPSRLPQDPLKTPSRPSIHPLTSTFLKPSLRAGEERSAQRDSEGFRVLWFRAYAPHLRAEPLHVEVLHVDAVYQHLPRSVTPLSHTYTAPPEKRYTFVTHLHSTCREALHLCHTLTQHLPRSVTHMSHNYTAPARGRCRSNAPAGR
eukprot:6129463-Pyramimonas_sp.AAC.1